MSVLLGMAVGCSSDDANDSTSPTICPVSKMLTISKQDNNMAESYSVKGGKFYIDMMPVLENNCPRFIFHCGFADPDIKELVIRFLGIKQDTDAFHVGETFQKDQFEAYLTPTFKESGMLYSDVRKGSIKLVDKKRVGDKDVLTFQIDDLSFGDMYIISGLMDFEYEGTVY